MPKRPALTLLLLLLGACTREPSASSDTPIAVVAVRPSSPAAVTVAAPVAVPTPRPEAPRVRPELLTVEQSARIRTAEMWSEPIKAID